MFETRYFFLFGLEVFAFLARRVLFLGAAFLRVFFPEDRFFLRLGFSDMNQSSMVYFFLRAILFPSLIGVNGNASSLASSLNL